MYIIHYLQEKSKTDKIHFFFLKEKVAKRTKNPCRIYRLCQFCHILKLLAPPRVEILFVPHKIYSEPRRIFAIYRFVCRDRRPRLSFYIKSANHSFASRFRRMFVRHEQTSRAGRGALFQVFPRTDKAIKRHVFPLLLQLFSFG